MIAPLVRVATIKLALRHNTGMKVVYKSLRQRYSSIASKKPHSTRTKPVSSLEGTTPSKNTGSSFKVLLLGATGILVVGGLDFEAAVGTSTSVGLIVVVVTRSVGANVGSGAAAVGGLDGAFVLA